MIIHVFNQIIIYIFQRINNLYIQQNNCLYIQRNNYFHSTNYLYLQQNDYFYSTKQSLHVWSTKYKLGNWNLVFILNGFKRKAKEKPYIYPSALPMATKLDRVVTRDGRDPTFKVMWLFDCVITWQIKNTYICSSAIPTATKPGRLVTCGGGTPCWKSRDLLITWSCDKFEKLISALPQYLWPSDLTWW